MHPVWFSFYQTDDGPTEHQKLMVQGWIETLGQALARTFSCVGQP